MLVRRITTLAGPLVLAAAVVWLGFSAGGFFAGTVGVAALIAGLGLVVWTTVAARPFAGLGPALAVAAAALGLLAVWTLLSAGWSGAPARATTEFDRVVLYLLAVLLGGLALRGDRVRRLPWGIALAAVLVCGAGLVTRLLPGVWPIVPTVQAERLSYPVTYWNALGLLATLGTIACLHITAWERSPVAARVLAAAGVPVLTTTLLFTFSRGALGLLPVGVLAYLLLGRPRGAVGALVAVVPPAGVAFALAYGADALAGDDPTAPAAIAEGRGLAPLVALCVLAAGALRAAMLPVDARLARVRVGPAARRRLVPALAAVVLVAVVVPAALAGAPGWIDRQVTEFARGETVSNAGDRRSRLTTLSGNGRVRQWQAAIEAFEREPLRGEGAGTYAIAWARSRPDGFTVIDAHSLYVEVLGELGIVGLALVLVALGALLAGCVRRALRGPDRAVGALASAVLLVWAVRAGIDWDWEMPVVTLPVLAVAAAAAGARRERVPAPVAAPPQLARVLVALGVLLVILTPALVWQSQVRLDRAVSALRRGDCPRAIDQALASTGVLGVRPEPFEVLGYCDLRLGQLALGRAAFVQAVKRDPRNWQVHYGLAVAKAAAGEDPRPRLEIARRLDPRGDLVRATLALFATSSPREWKRRAAKARLPI